MCNQAGIDFVARRLLAADVAGKTVLEVGACDVNGSVRPLVAALRPASYLGVDLAGGPGVDLVCDACTLVDRFGEGAFGVLICMEVVEHVRDWRPVVSNLKHVLAPGGVMILSTRSRGFVYHGYPDDFWRFEPADMERLFSDFVVEAIERDSTSPGVFVKVRRPHDFVEAALPEYALYSVMTGTKRRRISALDIALFRTRTAVGAAVAGALPASVKRIARRLCHGPR